MGVRWGKEPLTGCDQNSPQWGREQLHETVREGYPEKVMFQLSLKYVSSRQGGGNECWAEQKYLEKTGMWGHL